MPPSLNPKYQVLPKKQKVRHDKYGPPPDPSSPVPTETHKHKIVYTDADGNEHTYYVPRLPHKHFQEQWDGICAVSRPSVASIGYFHWLLQTTSKLEVPTDHFQLTTSKLEIPTDHFQLTTSPLTDF